MYMFTHGYVRTSSDEFNLNERAKNVHLTNYCMQIHSSSFGSHEAGNTISFAQLDQYLEDTDGMPSVVDSGAPDTAGDGWGPRMRHIIAQMEAVVADTGAATKHRLATAAASMPSAAKPAKPAKSLKQRVAERQARMQGGQGEAKSATTTSQLPSLRERQVGA